MAAKPVPEGYGTVTPYLVIKNAAQAIDWYREALHAEEVMRMPGPDGRIMHGEIRIGNSILMLCDEFPEMGSNWKSPQSAGGAVTTGFMVYVDDCDAWHQRAVAAGAKDDGPPTDMFWGDRYGLFTDPFGHSWAIATHKEDLSPEQIQQRQQQHMAQMTTKPQA